MKIRPLHAALAVAAGAILVPVIRKRVRNHREAAAPGIEHDDSGMRNGRDNKDSGARNTQRVGDTSSVGHRSSAPIPAPGGQRATT